MVYIFNIRVTIWMLHRRTNVALRLEIRIASNNEISEVDHYTWIFTSKIFRLALGITFYLTSVFSYNWLGSYSHKVENLITGVLVVIRAGVWKIFWKNYEGGRLLGPRETSTYPSDAKYSSVSPNINCFLLGFLVETFSRHGIFNEI